MHFPKILFCAKKVGFPRSGHKYLADSVVIFWGQEIANVHDPYLHFYYIV